ncbi:hypothetical protein LPJ56_004597 [Coemansia sp. RSA 2599]|nr:hypothetical protein LPJ75_004455 [Coemansia sp. RSA 2598]KAJ1815340.1 hypothetical protein LPJ56_004597 [Coemansia sp. RSA 2599]
MSSTAAAPGTQAKKSYLVVIDDFTDAEALSRRLEVRNHHLSEATKKRLAGQLVSGGAVLDSHENGKMVGSALVLNADSVEEVVEILKNDPYTVGRAWNMESVRIYPYREAQF